MVESFLLQGSDDLRCSATSSERTEFRDSVHGGLPDVSGIDGPGQMFFQPRGRVGPKGRVFSRKSRVVGGGFGREMRNDGGTELPEITHAGVPGRAEARGQVLNEDVVDFCTRGIEAVNKESDDGN